MNRSPKEIPSSLKNIDVKALLRSRGVYLEQKTNKEMKAAALPIAREMVKSKKSVKTIEKPQKYRSFTDDEAMNYWEKQVHTIDIIEKKFETKVQQFVMKVVREFVQHIDSEITKEQLKKVNSFKTKDFFDDNEDDLVVSAQLDFTPLLIDQAVIAGQEALKLIKGDQLYLPDIFRKNIADNVTAFTKSMLSTDKQKLIDIIASGIELGNTVSEIRDKIELDFNDYSKMQAERITRTEVARVSNQAAIDAWEQSGVVEGKQWVTFGATDECEQYDGQIVALKADFYGDTDEFADGDPPLHPNCRCGTIPVLIDEN